MGLALFPGPCLASRCLQYGKATMGHSNALCSIKTHLTQHLSQADFTQVTKKWKLLKYSLISGILH